jgi:hypothetical protein
VNLESPWLPSTTDNGRAGGQNPSTSFIRASRLKVDRDHREHQSRLSVNGARRKWDLDIQDSDGILACGLPFSCRAQAMARRPESWIRSGMPDSNSGIGQVSESHAGLQLSFTKVLKDRSWNEPLAPAIAAYAFRTFRYRDHHHTATPDAGLACRSDTGQASWNRQESSVLRSCRECDLTGSTCLRGTSDRKGQGKRETVDSPLLFAFGTDSALMSVGSCESGYCALFRSAERSTFGSIVPIY